MEKKYFREFTLASGAHVFLGKNAKQNEELVNRFKGKENVILHTANPGSPFCVIEDNLNPSRFDITASGAICARYSQDWRDNKGNVLIHKFTGKDVYKEDGMKLGMFGVKDFEVIKVKKKDIEKFK
ncbi:DUF814 domain-containing protein [Candidatus Pacearchaeota archaeon]|nr:DUF814 domain-containing protein [Candidatus Pacearchaeota archaeon]